MTRPFFSILIPTFNRAAHLRRCLESLMLQDLRETEIIVSDNASTDNTPEVIAQYGSMVSRYIRREENIGALANILATSREATGRYVVLHQDDDFLAPFFLSECRRLLERHPSATMFCCPIWDGEPASGLDSAMPGYLLKALGTAPYGDAPYAVAPGGVGMALFLFSAFANPPAVALSNDALAKGDGFSRTAAGGGADILAAAQVLQHGDMIYYPFTGCTHTTHGSNFCKKRRREDRRQALHQIITMVMDEMRRSTGDWRSSVLQILAGMGYAERCRHYRRFLKYSAPADLLAVAKEECQPTSLRQLATFVRSLGGSGLAVHLGLRRAQDYR